MTKTLKLTSKVALAVAASALLVTSAQAAAVTLIGWDDATPTATNNTPAVNDAQDHVFVTGISGVINDGRRATALQGSTDGTFGALTEQTATATTGRYEIRGAGTNAVDDRIAVTITNGTGLDLELDTLVFDFARVFAGSPQTFDVVYKAFASNDTLGTSDVTLLTVTSLATNGTNNDMDDYSANIASLADFTLADTESATFHIIGSAATGTGAAAIDNIAFTGSVIAVPEPSTYALIAGALALTSVMLRRRK
jgi:hypothetical protein